MLPREKSGQFKGKIWRYHWPGKQDTFALICMHEPKPDSAAWGTVWTSIIIMTVVTQSVVHWQVDWSASQFKRVDWQPPTEPLATLPHQSSNEWNSQTWWHFRYWVTVTTWHISLNSFLVRFSACCQLQQQLSSLLAIMLITIMMAVQWEYTCPIAYHCGILSGPWTREAWSS